MGCVSLREILPRLYPIRHVRPLSIDDADDETVFLTGTELHGVENVLKLPKQGSVFVFHEKLFHVASGSLPRSSNR